MPPLPDAELWVFAYGSLMWNPGFDYLDKHLVRVYGYHRALCVWSRDHRGSEQHPGLVVGLDVGGSCTGIAYRIAANQRCATIEYLAHRELSSAVYRPRLLCTRWNRSRLNALSFVVDRNHPDYAGSIDSGRAATTIRRATGVSGSNFDYVDHLLKHLQGLRLPHAWLHQITDKL